MFLFRPSQSTRLERPREDVPPETAGVRCVRVPEEGQAEQTLDRAQRREVVVWHAADRPRPDERRQRNRADPAATATRDRTAVVRRIRELRLVAARARVRARIGGLRLVERDQEQT